MNNSKANIVVTIGPASQSASTIKAMIEHQMDVARLNFSYADLKTRSEDIKLIRRVAKECGRNIPIIQDLPGPRLQGAHGHTYDLTVLSGFTEHDRELAKFGIDHGIDYIALSFVSSAEEIKECRDIIKKNSGNQKIIAKIERRVALESLNEIIDAADAIMIARGDLGNEVPLEEVPFVQADIIRRCKKAGKPVVVATEMLLSMTKEPRPTRAEVTDVANAILQGSDAVMLSEETAIGKYPVESVAMMEKILIASERHMGKTAHINSL